MAISISARVGQKRLARELKLTERRIRQLVAAHLLPEPSEEGFDLARCREFYGLYSNGSTRAWRDFHDELGAAAVRVERMVKKAESLTKTDLAKAGRAARELFEGLRFSIAAQSDSDAERSYHRLICDRLEADTFGPLLHRAAHVFGAEKGLTGAEIEHQLEMHG